MPISEYFGGHGKKVMAEMRKKHGKRAEEVFYRTANKKGMMKPRSHMPAGAGMSPKDHICCDRADESKAAGGFGERHMHADGRY